MYKIEKVFDGIIMGMGFAIGLKLVDLIVRIAKIF